MHFAAFKSIPESMSRPLKYYDNNVSGLVQLLSLLDEYCIRHFIFSSSAAVYGAKLHAGSPLREEELVHHQETVLNIHGEAEIIEPVVAGLTCPYARTKYMGEAILADVAKGDPSWRIAVLRYFNPVGCHPSYLLGERLVPGATNLYPALGQVLKGVRQSFELMGSDWPTRDGSSVRDFVHVLDVARGHIAALQQSLHSSFRTFNLGTGSGTTVLEAVRTVEAIANTPIPVTRGPRRVGDLHACVAVIQRAAEELHWCPRENPFQGAVDLCVTVQRDIDKS
ncbi:hypothetical protein JX265_004195 [Neoarthrinium moseri]|uniref:NAD-dependent epimerase/dehydratase domain-containing protein n=1 Tax=Neoarthrinium moseri TaxID=1658444 RepID=A0A9Q0ASW8_9PEZI|nr:hypothetical protein JX265_004195 [Neoarthrinium moseri]